MEERYSRDRTPDSHLKRTTLQSSGASSARTAQGGIRVKIWRDFAFAIAVIASLLLFHEAAIAQSQTQSPSSCANQTGIGSVDWDNEARAVSSNNSYATAVVDGSTTNFLRCTDYGFNIPSGVTVLGIEVKVERKSSRTQNGGSEDAAMRLVKGGVIQATDRSSGTTYTTGDVVETHGSPTDLWGTTWTPTDINSANFGAAFAATKPSAGGNSHTISVDHIQITVYYSNNAPPAPSLSSPADGAIVTTSTPTFTWSTVIDPDGDTVTYDVQADASGCSFASPEMSQTSLASPSFTPGTALPNATYCWRARAVDQWGAASSWSTTRQVVINAPLSETQSPAAGACTNQAGIGSVAWANTGNAVSSNNSYATATVDGSTTNYLRCLSYGFNIPAGATILGIEVNVERKSSRTQNGGSEDAAMRLVKGGTIQTTDRSSGTTYTTGDVVETHGSPTDLWGTTWAAAEINAANFGAAFAATKANGGGNSHAISVDHIQITVYYSIPAVVPTPGNFNAFETSAGGAAITGQIYTKLAGAGFSVDVVAILSGVRQVTFTDAVAVDLVTGSTGGANCPGSPVAIGGSSQTVNLTIGRGTTGSFNIASAASSVRVRVQYPAASPTVVSCSTNAFTIRPTALTAVASPTLTNSVATGTPQAKAGDAFDLTATAVTGYDGTPSIDNTKIVAHAGAFQAGSISGSFGAANPIGGSATGSAFTYSEVGNFTIGINGVYDNAFTNGSSDPSDGDCTADFSNTLDGSGRYGCYFGNSSASAIIGRFTPDHFDVSINTPTFATGCAAGNFTYVGQTFGYTVQPVMTVTAKNAGNSTTRNYRGSSWWKITNGSLTGKNYAASTGTLDTTGIMGTDPVIRFNGDGLPGEPAAGEGTLTFSSGTGLFFTRVNPVATFNAEISLAINVADSDGVTAATNPARFGQAAAGLGMAFNNGKPMRFGRLIATNARGSHLVPLSMTMELQYWNGTAFITNTMDSCTTVAASNIEMRNFSQNLDPCETSLTAGAFANGRATARLSKLLGSGNTGSVTLVPRLEQTPGGSPQTCIAGALQPVVGANLPYLEGKWDGTDQGADGKLYDDNPAGRATFGVYSGTRGVIDFRENF
jgi:uncharacterized protein DUF6701